MHNTNIILANVSIFYPDNKVDKEFFLGKFDNQGIDIRGLMSSLGRDEIRVMKDKEETAITMGVKAAEKALKALNLKPEDIDMLVFATDNPEYFAPSNALITNNILGLKNAKLTFDMNNNCISLITAMDIVGTLMKCRKEVKRTMLIGVQAISYFTREDDMVMYPGGGDCAACLILEKEESAKERGLVDTIYHIDASHEKYMKSPGCGISKIMTGEAEAIDMKLRFTPYDVGFFVTEWTRLITELLEKNNLTLIDIDHYLFSQFSLDHIKATLNTLEVSEDKFTFVSDKYGYTGCCSPFFAYHNAKENGDIKKDTYIIFCSVGIGYSMAVMLYKV